MPMYTASTNTGVVLKANINLTQQDLLRVGTEYQRYRLDDWWPASGAGMWPSTFWNINDGERDRTALFGEWEKQHSKQWMTLAGLRYERVMMDTGDVHGLQPSRHPQPIQETRCRMPSMRRSRRDRQQLGHDRAGALHA